MATAISPSPGHANRARPRPATSSRRRCAGPAGGRTGGCASPPP